MLRVKSAKMKRAPAPPLSRRSSSLPPGHCFGNGSLSLHDSGGPILTAQPLGDECAINELLEGRMDLDVHLPGEKTVRMTVERRTPMMDLLIQVTTANKINPGGHIIQLLADRGRDSVHYKPSTPIGSLDTNTIYIVPKSASGEVPVKKMQKVANQPFEQTFRLQVNLPRNQLMVMRVSPRTTLAEVKHTICSDKNLDSSRYHLVHPSKPDVVLDLNNTLATYGCNEISLLSNKSVSANIRNYQTDLIAYSAREDGVRRRGLMSLFSRKKSRGSTGDSSSDGIDSRGESPCRSDNSGNQNQPVPGKAAPKKRPAPPPPTAKPAAAAALQIEVSASDASNCGVDGSTVYHSRHSSDSSGYHEASVLSESPDSLSPETSCGSSGLTSSGTDSPVHATPVEKEAALKKDTAVPTEPVKEKVVRQSSSMSHVSTMSKKRKAPPPPKPQSSSACISEDVGTSGAAVVTTVATTVVTTTSSQKSSDTDVSEQNSSSSVLTIDRSTESVVAASRVGDNDTQQHSSAPDTVTSKRNASISEGESHSNVSALHTSTTLSDTSTTIRKEDEVPSAELDHSPESHGESPSHPANANEEEPEPSSIADEFPSSSLDIPIESSPEPSSTLPEMDSELDECVEDPDDVIDGVEEPVDLAIVNNASSVPQGTAVARRPTSLSLETTTDEQEADFQQTISETEKAIIREELEKIPQSYRDHEDSSRMKAPESTDAPVEEERDMTQQEILSHIEAAFSVVEAVDSSPLGDEDELKDAPWEYPVPEPPSPFRGNGETLPEFPEEPPSKSTGDTPRDSESSHQLKEDSVPHESHKEPVETVPENFASSDVQSVNRVGQPDESVGINSVTRDSDYLREEPRSFASESEDRPKSINRLHSTLPRRPLMNFSIGTYRSSKSEDFFPSSDDTSKPDFTQDDEFAKPHEASSASNTLTRTPKKGANYGGPGVRIGSFQERNRTVVVDDKLYDPEGTVRGIKGKVQTLRAEMKSLPMMMGRSASMMNLTDSKKLSLETGVKAADEDVHSRSAELKKTSSEIGLNGTSGDMVDGHSEEDHLEEKYSKLQNQFIVWQKQLEHNQALLRKQKIDVPRPTLSGIRPVSVKGPEIPEHSSQPVTDQKAQTLPRPKPRPLSYVEMEQRTSTLGHPPRPKSQVLANVSIAPWHQRSKNNSLTDLLARFESIEKFDSQPVDDRSTAKPVNAVSQARNEIVPEKKDISFVNGSNRQPSLSKINIKIGNGVPGPKSSVTLNSFNAMTSNTEVARSGSKTPQESAGLRELNGSVATSKKPPPPIKAPKPAPRPPEKNVTKVNIVQKPQSPIPAWKRASAPVVKGFSLKQPDRTLSESNSTSAGSIPQTPVSKNETPFRPSVVSFASHANTRDASTKPVPNGLPTSDKPVSRTMGHTDSVKKSSAPPPPPPMPVPDYDQPVVPKSPVSPKESANSSARPLKSPKSTKPPAQVPKLDPREELMLEIRNFTANGALRK